MPKGHSKSHFQKQWFEKIDKNGQKVSLWLREVDGDSSAAYCSLCAKKFDVSTMGWPAVQQHCSGKTHEKKAMLLSQHDVSVTAYFVKQADQASTSKVDDKLQSTKCPPAQCAQHAKPTGTQSEMKQHLTVADQVTKAEALWAMKVANGHLPFASADHLPELFQSMFPDSLIAKNFSLSSVKVSYMLSHGLGPYFSDKLCDELRGSDTFYTVFFDETTTVQNRKTI